MQIENWGRGGEEACLRWRSVTGELDYELSTMNYELSTMSCKRIIFVLGCHRSGTSAVAGLLAGNGVCFGPETGMMATCADNARGYFERPSVMMINNDIMRVHGCGWYDSDVFKCERAVGERYAADMDGVYRKCFAERGEGAIGLKDPRFCFTFEYWRRVYEKYGRIDIVFVVRKREAVVESLKRSRNMTPGHALAFVDQHWRAMYRYANAVERSITVSYDEVVEGRAEGLAEFLGVKEIDFSSIDEELKHY